MKKLLFFFSIYFIFCFAIFAQSDITQVVLPKTIYVGDTAELRYTFRSAVDFFSGVEENTISRKIELKSLHFETDTDEYTIINASLSRTGLLYTFNVTFIPWKTGTIDFPMFDIANAVYGNMSASFMIDTKPFEVSSILQNADEAQLRSSVGPLLLPGTMYAIYILAIITIIFLILIIRLIVKWQAICDAYKTKKLLRAYSKNAKELYRKLRKLEKTGNKIDDATFSTELQKLVRKYLDFRFGYHFSTVSTPSIMDAFETVMAGTMSEKKQSGAMSLFAVMRRTDYIRYARGSIDSLREPQDQYAAKFGEDERASLMRIVRDAVERFEGNEK